MGAIVTFSRDEAMEYFSPRRDPSWDSIVNPILMTRLKEIWMRQIEERRAENLKQEEGKS